MQQFSQCSSGQMYCKEASGNDKEVVEDVANNGTADEAVVDVDELESIADAKTVEETEVDQNEETLVDVAEEACKPMRIHDEVCADYDYETFL